MVAEAGSATAPRLHLRERGDSDEAVVLLHGFAGTSQDWDRVIAESSPRRHILAYDLPGHGGSIGFPQAGVAKVAARAVLADLAARGIEQAHFVGHSMGGAIASLCAIFEPARVASLLLLAPGGFGPEINHRLLCRYAAAADAAILRVCLENMYGWRSAIPEQSFDIALSMRRDAAQLDALVDMAALLAPGGNQGTLPIPALAQLPMPKRVVWSELDNVLPVAQARRLPAAFAVDIVPGVGHMLPQEIPVRIAALIDSVDCTGWGASAACET